MLHWTQRQSLSWPVRDAGARDERLANVNGAFLASLTRVDTNVYFDAGLVVGRLLKLD